MAAVRKGERNMQTLFGKMGVGLLLAAFVVLSGCQNPMQPPGDDTATGTLMLTLNRQGAARTILPTWPVEIDDSVKFTLTFSAVPDGSPSLIVEDWVPGDPIELQAGTWGLRVTAYLPGDLPLEGSHPGIVVPPRGTVNGNVALFPIATGGSGTFHWNVGFDSDIVAASMEILRHDLSPYWGPYYIIHYDRVTHDNPGFLVMDAGRYLVVFTLYNERGESVMDSRSLRIYRNMCSRFAYTFGDIPVSPLYLVLNAWNPVTGTWDFFDHGIDAWFFTTFLSRGITDNNFDDIVRWFNLLSADNPVPVNETELGFLVDAALVGIASEDKVFTWATNLWTQALAMDAIIDMAVNVALSANHFDWVADYYTVTVTIGVHNVSITFVPVPVTGVAIYGPSTRLLEETLYLNLSATAMPYDARYQGIRWEIPDEDERALVALYYDEAAGTVKVTGLSAGEAVIRAVSVADPTRGATVTVRVFPYGAGVPITDIEILNDAITLEVGEYENLVIQLIPYNTTQPDFTYVSSATGIATVSWEHDRLRIRAVSVGNTTITVRSTVNPDLFDTVVVTVNATPTGVVVEPSTANVPLNRTLRFAHAVQGPEGVSQDVTWVVRPENAGTIVDGLLTLTGATVNQELTVMATVVGTEPPVYGSATVRVTAPEPESVTMNSYTPTMIRGGYPQQFTVTVLPAGAAQNVVWGVAPQPAGVSITTTGLLMVGGTTVTDGTTLTVTATVPGTSLTATATVTVVVIPTSITMNPHTATMIRGGEPQQFTATVLPTGAHQNLAWSVYPAPEGVSISPTGVLTVGGIDAEHGVTLTVTARVPDTILSTEAIVSVIVIPTGVKMAAYTATIIRGGTPQQFNATVTPQGAPQDISWIVDPQPAGVSINALTGLLTVGLDVTPGISLTVKAMHGTLSRYATVTVTTPEPENVTVNPTSASLLRGATRQFDATVAGVPGTLDEVTWYVYPPTGGTITGQGLLTVGANASGILTVRARAVGHPLAYAEATVTVLAEETFTINFANIRNEARSVEYTAPDIGYMDLLDGQRMLINVTGTGGLEIDSFAWFFGGLPITNANIGVTISNDGTTLALDYSILNTIGRHRVTLEVVVDGVPFSRVITFMVAP